MQLWVLKLICEELKQQCIGLWITSNRNHSWFMFLLLLYLRCVFLSSHFHCSHSWLSQVVMNSMNLFHWKQIVHRKRRNHLQEKRSTNGNNDQHLYLSPTTLLHSNKYLSQHGPNICWARQSLLHSQHQTRKWNECEELTVTTVVQQYLYNTNHTTTIIIQQLIGGGRWCGEMAKTLALLRFTCWWGIRSSSRADIDHSGSRTEGVSLVMPVLGVEVGLEEGAGLLW